MGFLRGSIADVRLCHHSQSPLRPEPLILPRLFVKLV